MKILMVNPTHPSTPHISAVRAWRFSQELARLGHQVVLLTGSRAGNSVHPVTSFASHDWREPLVLVCRLETVESAVSPRRTPLRRATTAMRMLRHGGRHGDWVQEAVHTAVQLRDAFEPDVVWCTFGMLESVFAAKRIAAAVGCPWVLDVKDNWELYVPRGIRRLMSWRIKGWSAVTANSQLAAGMAAKWQAATASIVYSGVEPEFFPGPEDTVPRNSEFSLNLIGGIYFPALLDEFLDGVRVWLEGLPDAQRSLVVLRYLGGNVALAQAAASRLLPGVAFKILGYVPTAEMAHHCKVAAANAYIAHSGTFHHKLLELLACERPVIAFPSENRESLELATAMGGELLVADSQDAVVKVLTRLHAEWNTDTGHAPRNEIAQGCSWPKQALRLERALTCTVTGRQSTDDR